MAPSQVSRVGSGRGHSIISPYAQKGRKRMSTLKHSFATMVKENNGRSRGGSRANSRISSLEATPITTIDEHKKQENNVTTTRLQSPASVSRFSYTKDEDKPRVSLIIYELADVILTNTNKYDNISHVPNLKFVSDAAVQLSFGGQERINALQTHFDHVNINKRKLGDETKTNRTKGKSSASSKSSGGGGGGGGRLFGGGGKDDASVIAFVSARHHDTPLGFEILKRVNLHSYFVTEKQIKWGSKVIKKNLSHVIGRTHKLRSGLQYEYLLILKLLYVLRMDHDNALYIGHRKDIIDHLISINACHTYYVKTNGMTSDDFECIEKMYKFEPVR